MLDRLHEAISAVCPIRGVSATAGWPDNAVIHFATTDPGAQNKAWDVVRNFDWSQAAHDAWLLQKRRDAAKTAFDTRADYLQDLITALGLVLLDEINILRVREGLAQRTPAQLRTAVRTKVDQLT